MPVLTELLTEKEALDICGESNDGCVMVEKRDICNTDNTTEDK